MTLFEEVLEETRKNEEINECPMILRGIFFNTANDGKWLDAESQYCAEIMTDDDDLLDFLEQSNDTAENLKEALRRWKEDEVQ